MSHFPGAFWKRNFILLVAALPFYKFVGMKVIVTFFLLLCFALTDANSQKSVNSMAVQHAISLPLNRTNAFINNMSLRGVVLDYRYHPSPKTGIGLTSGWVAFFDSKVHDTHDVANGMRTASGRQYRYLNSVPLLVAIDHYIHPERILSRFIGLGLGTTYNRIDRKTGLYQTRLHAWQLTVAPEAGVRIGYDFSFSTYLSLRYTYSLETNVLSDQSYLSVNIGIMHR